MYSTTEILDEYARELGLDGIPDEICVEIGGCCDVCCDSVKAEIREAAQAK